jgi:hypothetical protein
VAAETRVLENFAPKFFFAGVLLLNFEARDFHSVVYRLVEEFGINDDLSAETKAEVLRTLLMPHRWFTIK